MVKTSEKFSCPETGLPRWNLLDGSGRHVLADSWLDGGGCRIVMPNDIPEEVGYEEVGAVIGHDHPAIALSKAMEAAGKAAQRDAGRALATILSDGRRWR